MVAAYTTVIPSVPRVPQRSVETMASLRLVRTTRALFLGTTLLFVALISVGVFQIKARTQPTVTPIPPSSRPVSSGPVYALAAGAVIPEVVPNRKPPLREVHIANTGLMLLRGATVLSNSNGVIRVGMEWGAVDFTWTLRVDSNTKYLTASGVKQTSNDVAVGDFVTVTGTLVAGGSEPRIDAEYVREN